MEQVFVQASVWTGNSLATIWIGTNEPSKKRRRTSGTTFFGANQYSELAYRIF